MRSVTTVMRQILLKKRAISTISTRSLSEETDGWGGPSTPGSIVEVFFCEVF
jgi:hypothetical protein